MFRTKVNKIVENIEYNVVDKNDYKKYVMLDYACIYKNVVNRNNPDFFDSKIIDRYTTIANKLGVDIEKEFYVANVNYEFRIYKLLNYKNIYYKSFSEGDHNYKKCCIEQEVKEYLLDDL